MTKKRSQSWDASDFQKIVNDSIDDIKGEGPAAVAREQRSRVRRRRSTKKNSIPKFVPYGLGLLILINIAVMIYHRVSAVDSVTRVEANAEMGQVAPGQRDMLNEIEEIDRYASRNTEMDAHQVGRMVGDLMAHGERISGESMPQIDSRDFEHENGSLYWVGE